MNVTPRPPVESFATRFMPLSDDVVVSRVDDDDENGEGVAIM